MSEPRVTPALAQVLRDHRARVAVVVVAVLGATAAELVPPFLVRSAIDDHLVGSEVSGLGTLSLLLLAAIAARQLLTFVYGYQAAALAQGALHDLRVRMVARVYRLPLDRHDRTPVGDTIARSTADLDTVQELATRGVITLAAGLVPLVAMAVAMIVLDPVLALVALCVVPPTVLMGRAMRLHLRDAHRESRAAVGSLATHVQDDAEGLDVIRTFRWEPAGRYRFRTALDRGLAAFNRSNLANSFFAPTIGILSGVVVAGLVAAATLGASGASAGTLAAFVLLFQRFVQPLTALGDEWQRVQEARAGAERVLEAIEGPVDSPAGAAEPAGPVDPLVHVSGVGFAHEGGNAVLSGIDLRVEAGEHVAIVGPTGSGKSTLLDLIAGLRRPASGTVRLAGLDPSALSDAERRELLAYVAQSELLHREGASSGPGASAGESQLLSLRGAVAGQPLVVLLDEATALVDPPTACQVLEAVAAEICQGENPGALVSVAHRLTSALCADRVIVVAGGRVVEEGQPAKLAQAGGPFSAMLAAAARGWPVGV